MRLIQPSNSDVGEHSSAPPATTHFTPPAVYILGLILIFVLSFGIYLAESLSDERYAAERRSDVQKHLYTLRNQLENNLVSDIQLAKGLVAALATDPQLDQPTFEKAAAALLKRNTQLLGLSAAPDLKIKLIYPLADGKDALGLDLRLVPEQFGAIERARKTGEIVLAGPVDLIEGGTAFIARMPISLENMRGEGYFWGIASALIDEQSLYRNSGILNHELPVEIAIRGRDALGAEGGVFFGRAELFNEQPELTEIQLPVGSWQLAAVPTSSYLGTSDNLAAMRLGYGGASLILLVAFLAMARAVRAASKARHQAEQAQSQLNTSLRTLHEREALLRTVIDEMPDVLVLKDRHGKFLLGNKAVARLYHTTPEEMVGKDDSDFGVPAEMVEFFHENVLAVIARGETEVVYEDSTDASTGEVRHFKSIKKPFLDTQGNSQILIIAHDITDIVNAQKQVAESEGKLRTILDNVDAYIYLKDIEGRYLFANQPIRNIWNSEEQDIVGFTDEKFFDAESALHIRENDRQVMVQGEALCKEEAVKILGSSEPTTYKTTKLPLRTEDGEIYALCGISVDISEIKRIEKALRESEQRFRVAGKAAYDLIYEWDVATDSLQWFGDIDRILGFEAGEVSHHIDTWLKLIHPDDVGVLADAVDLHRTSTQPIGYEYRVRHKDGTYRFWSDRALPLIDDDGHPYKWVGVCTDITTQKQQQHQLEFSAYHDKLTSLPNRLLLSDRLRQAMHQEDRRRQGLAVVYIDLDGFKEINDNHGHEIGDHLLVAIAHRFQRELREGDTIARLGGDEFVAVLIDIEDTASSIPLLRRILSAIAEPILIDDLVLQVSASLGVTFYPQVEDVDADQLMRQADQAMYQAKLSGKNRYYFFDTEHDRSMRGQRETQGRIAEALVQNELQLHYQPKVNMRSGQVVGMEALIRWNHPDEGQLQPGEFLPVIEDQPVAVDLGEWVIEQALQQIESWNNAGLDIPVSVNIGGLQLQQADFVQRLQAMLAAHSNVRPESLELEVLETSALQDIVKVSAVMRDCQAIGVSFALDDFGTGYSSLTYLKHLPAAVLKIDRSFVRDMLDDPDDLAILEGIMGMSSAFRRQVIAEGVEHIEHGAMLLQLGCELGQGYAIAKPMPADAVPGWMAQWQPPKVWQRQQRISRDDLSLLFAAIEHRAWVRAIDRYVHSDDQFVPPLDPCECRFGQWLYSEGNQRYGGSTLFEEIIDLHKQVHRCGEEVCLHGASGDMQAVSKAQDELNDLSDDLLSCLGVLLNDYAIGHLANMEQPVSGD